MLVHLCNLPKWWFIMNFSIFCICPLNQTVWSLFFFPGPFSKGILSNVWPLNQSDVFLKQPKTSDWVDLELMFKWYKHFPAQWINRAVPKAWIIRFRCSTWRYWTHLCFYDRHQIHIMSIKILREMEFLMPTGSFWQCSPGWQLAK